MRFPARRKPSSSIISLNSSSSVRSRVSDRIQQARSTSSCDVYSSIGEPLLRRGRGPRVGRVPAATSTGGGSTARPGSRISSADMTASTHASAARLVSARGSEQVEPGVQLGTKVDHSRLQILVQHRTRRTVLTAGLDLWSHMLEGVSSERSPGGE